jgi:ankyrin repeat protein
MAYVDSRSSDSGQTALSIAAEHGHFQVVELLTEPHCDVEALDRNGQTAQFHALRNKHMSVAHHLLYAGADPNTQAYPNGSMFC